MNKKFEVKWESYDGYVTGARPQSFYLFAEDINNDDTDEILEALYNEELQNDFQQSVEPVSKNRAEALEWMRKVRDEKAAE